MAKKVFNEYCDSSTIHGLKYLGTRPTHEKYVYLFVSHKGEMGNELVLHPC